MPMTVGASKLKILFVLALVINVLLQRIFPILPLHWFGTLTGCPLPAVIGRIGDFFV